jgi:hypothetical protein
MAILKGFPPSNCISPTIHITEYDLSQMAGCYNVTVSEKDLEPYKAKPLSKADQQKKYLLGNVWLQKKEYGKCFRLEIEAMLDRFKPLGMSLGVGENMMKDLMRVASDAQEVFCRDNMSFQKGPTWFLWMEYHVIHALSGFLQTDLRPAWVKTWEGYAGDGVSWVKWRMSEKLDYPTPLATRMKEVDPERCKVRETKTKPRNVIATRKLSTLQYWF